MNTSTATNIETSSTALPLPEQKNVQKRTGDIVLKNIISTPATYRLAHRSGIKRISATVTDSLNNITRKIVVPIMNKSVAIMELKGTKTIDNSIIRYVLSSQGTGSHRPHTCYRDAEASAE